MKSIWLALFVSAVLAGCTGYVPGQQTYWDEKVKEMCERDGGVRIYEQIVVSPSQAASLPKVGEFLAVMPESLAKPEQPAFIRTRRTQLREGNPSVFRYEQEIIRRSDQHVVGLAVSYTRGGGDVLPLDHPTAFSCPELTRTYEGIHKVYRIEETRK